MPPNTPVVTTPAPAAPPSSALFAKPGESLNDYETRLGAAPGGGTGTGFGTFTPAQPVTDLNTAHDEVARQLGFNSYQDAVTKLGAPASSTVDFYNNAYTAAGLGKLQASINQKNSDLNSALGKVNDNPWLDEASRVGRSRSLQTLAQGDIKNVTNQYNAGLKSVHDLVSQHDTDVKNNQAKLTLLESQAKQLATEANTPPKTFKAANGATYKYNPATQSFDQIFPGKNTSTDPNTVVPKFNKDLTNRATLDKAGTREQFIRQLQQLYPTIDPNDIAKKVYETYPDGYETKGGTKSKASGSRTL